ncbi:MAG: heparinase II/III family protein [Clostridia bacterium]|nr:heparinase II/III family protein [Clostridia bacterium]
MLAFVCMLLMASCGNTVDPTPTPQPPKPKPAKVVIFDGSDTDFQIVYSHTSSVDRIACEKFCKRLEDLGITVSYSSDLYAEEDGLEILIGQTDREISSTLKQEVVENTESGGLGWGFKFEQGQFAIYATSTDAYEEALDELFDCYFDEGILILNNHFDLISGLSANEYQTILAQRAEAEKIRKTAEVQALNDTFKVTDFGGEPMILKSIYDKPATYPTAGQHPRLVINEAMLPGIKEVMTTTEGAKATQSFKNMLARTFDGKLTTGITSGTNFNAAGLMTLEAKALEYQLSGDLLCGYQAIVGIKNFILSLEAVSGSDLTRVWGQTMFVAGEIYDWCYPLLSADDREQIIRGVENILCANGNMEMGFPPYGQTAISSHGAEAQLLRDYLGFAIAVYDERPDFWEYIGGRFYQEFVTFRNYYYESGLAPQGSGLYGQYRHAFDLWSAWIIKTMSGTNPYSENMEAVVLSFLASELPLDKELFATGDYYGRENIGSIDGGGTDPSAGKTYGLSAYLFHSALYNNSTSRAAAKYYSHDFSYFTYSNNYFTPTLYLILSSTGTETASDRHEDLPTVTVNGSPVGMITTREAWNDPDSVAIMMKIGERTTANHEHQDAGSFNIYYKGKLAFDSGVYGGYGSDHHFYYHQATISHNSLLIYNPALSSTDRGWYSGGQTLKSEANGFEDWMSDKYKTGTVTGESYAYSDGEGSRPSYAYLAGDITPAYSSQTVSEVERRMLTIYTGDETCPAIFVVYDNITALSGDFKKTFLLHTETEPTISGNKVTVVNGEGQLTLFNLIGGDSITKVGGENQNYMINGVQNGAYSNLASDGMWGRIEISPELGNKTDKMLNVMIISDTGAAVATPVSVSNSDLDGFTVMDRAVFFANTSALLKKTETVTVSGTGSMTYYFSGVASGNWSVSVNGQTVGNYTVAEGEGLLTFTAAAGTVTITPVS